MSDAPTGLRAKPLSRADRSAGHLLVIAVVIFVGAVMWRQYDAWKDDLQQQATDRKAALHLAQASEFEEGTGLQAIHMLNEIAPGGDWSTHRTRDVSRRIMEVRYTVGEKEWRWIVDLKTWEVQQRKGKQ